MTEAEAEKLLKERCWVRVGDGVWTTSKRGLKRHTAGGLTLREACSIESISYSTGEGETPMTKARAALKAAEVALTVEKGKLVEVERPYAKQALVVEGAVAAVEKAEQAVREERSQELLKLLLPNPGLIDLLAPKHTRTSCSDDKRDHAGCPRCFLLESRQSGWVDSDVSWEFVLR